MLDLAYEYNRELEQRDALSLERERFEDQLTSDFETFDKWASRYVREETGLDDFLSWCWSKREKELTPAFTKAWRTT